MKMGRTCGARMDARTGGALRAPPAVFRLGGLLHRARVGFLGGGADILDV